MRRNCLKTVNDPGTRLVFLWAVLTGYLFFHAWQWDPQEPFITRELLRTWFALAALMGLFHIALALDQVNKEYKLSWPWQPLLWGVGTAAYFMLVLGFFICVFIGMLITLDLTTSALEMRADTEPTLNYPYIGMGGALYLLLVFFSIVNLAQTFSVSAPLVRWFNTNMASWLDLTNPPAPPENPDKFPSQELDGKHPPTPEARYFRTTVQPGGRVEVASPELEVGQAVDAVVRPIQRRMR